MVANPVFAPDVSLLSFHQTLHFPSFTPTAQSKIQYHWTDAVGTSLHLLKTQDTALNLLLDPPLRPGEVLRRPDLAAPQATAITTMSSTQTQALLFIGRRSHGSRRRSGFLSGTKILSPHSLRIPEISAISVIICANIERSAFHKPPDILLEDQHYDVP